MKKKYQEVKKLRNLIKLKYRSLKNEEKEQLLRDLPDKPSVAEYIIGAFGLGIMIYLLYTIISNPQNLLPALALYGAVIVIIVLNLVYANFSRQYRIKVLKNNKASILMAECLRKEIYSSHKNAAGKTVSFKYAYTFKTENGELEKAKNPSRLGSAEIKPGDQFFIVHFNHKKFSFYK